MELLLYFCRNQGVFLKAKYIGRNGGFFFFFFVFVSFVWDSNVFPHEVTNETTCLTAESVNHIITYIFGGNIEAVRQCS